MTIGNICDTSVLVKFRSKMLTKCEIYEGLKDQLKKNEDKEDNDLYSWKLQDIESIPEWLRCNQYLLTGHRPPLPSVKACLLSAFRLHTETGNIWSHLIGSLVIMSLAAYTLLYSQYSTIEMTDKLLFGIFFASCVTGLSFSAIYHTMNCHSESAELWFLRLDFIGIILVIVGHTIPYYFYGFYCQPTVRLAYIAINILLAISVITILLVEKCAKAEYFLFRAVMFSAFASFGFIPAIHSIAINSDLLRSEVQVRDSVICLVLIMAIYYIAVFLHATQIPEKYFPGQYDYWFHSHQLFHILVVVAVLIHFYGIIQLSDFFRSVPSHFCKTRLQ